MGKSSICSLAALVPVIVLIASSFNEPALAITDGQYVDNMEDFPYLASFTMYPPYETGFCTGSILSRNYILTAAHCFRFAALRPAFNAVVQPGQFYNLTDIVPTLGVRIRVGQPDITSPDIISVNVSQLAVPPGYPYPNGAFVNNLPSAWAKDMVILKLATPLTYSSRVRPVKILNEKGYKKLEKEQKENCIMAGWGGLGTNTNKLISGTWKIPCMDICYYGTIDYYDFWQNKQNFSNTPYSSQKLRDTGTNMTLAIKKGMVCAAPNPANIQGGNSGGPGLVRSKNGTTVYQIGVVSNNFSRTTALECPSARGFVFTRPGIECAWIKQVTNGEVKCHDYN